jgi:hypothetical protein
VFVDGVDLDTAEHLASELTRLGHPFVPVHVDGNNRQIMKSYLLVCGADIATLRTSEERFRLGHDYPVEISIAAGDDLTKVLPDSELRIEVVVRDVLPHGDTATLLCTIRTDCLAVYPDLGRLQHFRLTGYDMRQPQQTATLKLEPDREVVTAQLL